ncbi:MAG: hypothetical protein Ct9H300mP13_5200 [Gammaproteobacteria bacterium]|nr:MAG: hypothetical protein Ct9H300mP13_5200 [Gammaproteobacteria bacterium]
MASYSAPLRDMRFVYHELFDSSDISALPGFEEATPDLIDTVLKRRLKSVKTNFSRLIAVVMRKAVATTGEERSQHPAVCASATVPTPKRAGLDYPMTHNTGAQRALSRCISTLLEEMVCSSNISFGTYVGLTRGAYRAIAAFGSDTLKTRYLPKLTSGEWSGTMCLTEPQCGTDLGLFRTRAEPNADGSYRVTGKKIFITAGEHDLTENIIHLVLARLPDAPTGVRGISLFLVPKFLPNPDGDPGDRNGVLCTALENKMGIKASANPCHKL